MLVFIQFHCTDKTPLTVFKKIVFNLYIEEKHKCLDWQDTEAWYVCMTTKQFKTLFNFI